MISGANEEQLELAGARMDIMLATNYTPENPGPLAIIDKYHDKEIDRLNNIVEQLENIKKEAIEYVKEHARIDDEYPAYIEMLLEEKQDLLNILNKGE